jgi:DNA mismatch endonuclease, patch repair protein
MQLKSRQKKAKTKTSKPTELRSRIMRAIKSKGTKPEVTVEFWLRSARFKPLLHEKTLPGSPDFVLPRIRTAIFVHGCFWHGHGCKRGGRLPATNRSYWLPKLAANKRRDASVKRKLRRLGWRVITVWECKVKDDGHRQRMLRKIRNRVR